MMVEKQQSMRHLYLFLCLISIVMAKEIFVTPEKPFVLDLPNDWYHARISSGHPFSVQFYYVYHSTETLSKSYGCYDVRICNLGIVQPQNNIQGFRIKIITHSDKPQTKLELTESEISYSGDHVIIFGLLLMIAGMAITFFIGRSQGSGTSPQDVQMMVTELDRCIEEILTEDLEHGAFIDWAVRLRSIIDKYF